MTDLQKILTEHGASIRGVPNKSYFWFASEADPIELEEELARQGKEIKLVREGVDGWRLYRFVGQRKPGRTLKVHDRSAPGGVSENLVIRVTPDGVVTIRESKRRVEYTTTVAAIYTRLVITQVFKERMKKGKARKGRKK
jgi:hypothetical protein